MMHQNDFNHALTKIMSRVKKELIALGAYANFNVKTLCSNQIVITILFASEVQNITLKAFIRQLSRK